MSSALRSISSAFFACVCALAVSGLSHAEAVLHVDAAGKLTGASGVNVNGTLYNVEFREGRCATIFDACSLQSSTFNFHTLADATSASEALLSQVFLDTAAGAFDSAPDKTYGCESRSTCFVTTPYAMRDDGQILVSLAYNYFDSRYDTAATYVFDPLWDTTYANNYTWAVWSVPATVPEPGALALVAAAGLGLAMVRRRGRVGAGRRAT